MADLSAYNPWAAPVFPNRDDNAMQPETYSNPLAQGLLSQLAGAIGRGFMAPGQALASTTPITSGQMVAPAMDMAGMATLGAGAIPQEANTLNMGIKAYHGSPHDFDAFSMDKIGTGEGAQAYGHGLYFADREGTAKAYRDQLAGRTIDDKPVADLAQDYNSYSPYSGKPEPTPESKVAAYLQDYNTPEHARLMMDRKGHWDSMELLDKMVADGRVKTGGHMYEVNINADPAHFLDWDKPLTQQSPKVQDAAKQAMGPNWDEFKYAKAGDAVKQGFLAPGADTTAAALHQAGIPGIKYLDQGSRGAGEGSSNYVVFNDKLIDILRKYAVPGMMGAPIFASQLGEQKS